MNFIKDFDNLFENELKRIKTKYPILPIEFEDFEIYSNNFYNYVAVESEVAFF